MSGDFYKLCTIPLHKVEKESITSNNVKRLRSRLVGADNSPFLGDPTKPGICLPNEVLENIYEYLDVSSLRQCRLVSKIWNDEAERALMKEKLTTKWEGPNVVKRENIVAILDKTEVPKLFSNCWVSSGSRLKKSLPLFYTHGDIISTLHLTFKPEMTQKESNEALGNIWKLVTHKKCKNIRELKLEIPLKSNYSNLKRCNTDYYINKEYLTAAFEMPHSLQKIEILGCFIFQFPDFVFQLSKSNKDNVTVKILPRVVGKVSKLYEEYFAEAMKEFLRKITLFKKAAILKNTIRFFPVKL